jgi:hypothetical protein
VNVSDNDVRVSGSHGLQALTDLNLCKLHLEGNYFSTDSSGYYGAAMRGLMALYVHSSTFSNSAVGGTAYQIGKDAASNNVVDLMLNGAEIDVDSGTSSITLADVTRWRGIVFLNGISPEGLIPAPVGTMFVNGSGGTGTTFYVKESGSSTSPNGWAAK